MIAWFCFMSCANLSSVTCGPRWKVVRLDDQEFPVVARQAESFLTDIRASSAEVFGCLHMG
jgi:hypothetical protein